MTVLGAIAWFVTGQQFTVLIPGLTPLRGNAAYLILSGIGSSIPFGPWKSRCRVGRDARLGCAARRRHIRRGCVRDREHTGRFALPSIALLILAATGGLSPDRGAGFFIAIIGMVIFFVAAGTMLVVVTRGVPPTGSAGSWGVSSRGSWRGWGAPSIRTSSGRSTSSRRALARSSTGAGSRLSG